jgi:hypothetical protein
MRLPTLLLSALLLFGLATGPAVAQESDWTTLFDGTDVNGWSHVGDGSFVLEDGVLRTRGGMGLLWYTSRTIGDAVLEVEYRAPDTSNAGVFIRIPEEPEDPWMPVNRGYEVQIFAGGDATHRTGVLYSLTEAKAEVGGGDGWNTLTVTLDGDRTMVHVNDTLVTDYAEGDPVPEKEEDYEPDRGPRPAEGYIGLQNHGEGDTVYYRRVRVRPLDE